jgi:REP element-mobilizing transposase RayT
MVADCSARILEEYDRALDEAAVGPQWLSDYPVAQIVMNALMYANGRVLDLFAACMMPNHVHLVFGVAEASASQGGPESSEFPVTRAMSSLKKYTALRANRHLHRSGPFWQPESYDHVIRDSDELLHQVWYVIQNPVKARLVTHWKTWPWTYLNSKLIGL